MSEHHGALDCKLLIFLLSIVVMEMFLNLFINNLTLLKMIINAMKKMKFHSKQLMNQKAYKDKEVNN